MKRAIEWTYIFCRKYLGLGLGLGLKDVPTWVTGSYDTPLDRAFKELSNGPISSVQIL